MSDWLLSGYDLLRGLHILAVIAWMAGLLYLPRLFVYHCDATPGGELDETLKLQEERLLRVIMNPAMIAVWVFGLLLVWSNAARSGDWSMFLTWPWISKLLLVSAMTWIHHVYALRRKAFAAGTNEWPQRRYRMLNEVPFLLAIFIVLIATIALR